MSAAPVLKSISMADGCLTFPPTLFASQTSHPFLPVHSKPSKSLRFSCSSSPSPLSPFFSLRRKFPFASLVAQTSDWARQEEEIDVEGEDPDWQDEDLEENQEGEEGEAAAFSDWEGEEEAAGGVVAEGEPEAEGDGFAEEGEEESYPEPPEEAKLFVGNLSFDIDSEKLAQLFEEAGNVEVAEVIYNRETDQSRGFGFVTMSTVEEAEKAVEMFNRYDVKGRLLTVNKAAPRGSRQERAPRESESSLKIYVGNLPWQVDDARLEQVFSEHGKVIDAKVLYDRESGRSRGFGFITMASKPELDDAIAALDGQTLDGRALRVNIAEERPRRGSF